MGEKPLIRRRSAPAIVCRWARVLNLETGMVSIFMDQAGASVGREMDRLSRLPSLSLTPTGPSSLYYAANADSPAYTWAASHARPREAEAIIDAVFRTLERLDGSRHFITIVADASQGLGAGLHSALLQQLSDCLPQSLRSVLLLPPSQSFSGVGLYNACLCSHESLATADCTMVRGMDDALHLAASVGPAASPATTTSTSKGSGGSSGGLSVRDAHAVLASDLFFSCGLYRLSYAPTLVPILTLCPSAHPYSPPSSGSTQSTRALKFIEVQTAWPCVAKVMDVRTSLYRLHREVDRRGKGGAGGGGGGGGDRGGGGGGGACLGSGHSPLRAMATNLHALHLSHASDGGSAVAGLAVDRAYIHTCRLGAEGMVVGDCEYSSAEVGTALGWACPKVAWPVGGGGASSSRDRGGGAVGRDMAGTGTGAGGSITVAAVAYACPYAARTLTRTAARAALLFERRAFLQRFDEFGLDRDEIGGCIDGLLAGL